jgi:hypothetical protein
MTSRRVHPEQLDLFPAPAVPERFRIDDDTRRRGLRHVAELKALLDARAASAARAREPVGDRARSSGRNRQRAA